MNNRGKEMEIEGKKYFFKAPKVKHIEEIQLMGMGMDKDNKDDIMKLYRKQKKVLCDLARLGQQARGDSFSCFDSVEIMDDLLDASQLAELIGWLLNQGDVGSHLKKN